MTTVYDLTPLTRGADAQRRWVIKGFDVNKRAFMVTLVSLVPGLVVLGIVSAFLKEYAIVPAVVTVAASVYFFNSRQRKNMQLRPYQAAMDRRKYASSRGQIFLCGHPITLGGSQVTWLRRASVTRETTAPTVDDLFAAVKSKVRHVQPDVPQWDMAPDVPVARSPFEQEESW